MATAIDNQRDWPIDDFRDEFDLITALRRDESTAHETFVWRYGGRMLATARRFLRCEQDCHDAVQEAFISAFRAIGDFEGNAKLGTWLHRILVNACLMKLRSRSRRHEVSRGDQLPKFDECGHHRRSISRWHQPVDEHLQCDETRKLVRRCIDMLPDSFRSILLLRDIDELSTEETAATLMISSGAVKTRLHRARQALRTLLEPHFVR
ncbi:MAG: sigma-70 family RNA polymerase sigma factor [Planctomycetia bacterium]|nr:sigma-70 family RNA polymerase sigma factor [Planctomycetia bacterium]